MGPKVTLMTELGFMFRSIPTKPMPDYASLNSQKPFNFLRFLLSIF